MDSPPREVEPADDFTTENTEDAERGEVREGDNTLLSSVLCVLCVHCGS
jgi:hypothetical protein